jgi:hypothetical protein
VQTRILAIIESDGNLLFSVDRKNCPWSDAESPIYTVVHNTKDLYPEVGTQPIAGIRGRSTIPTPGGGGESLLFAMAEDNRSRGARDFVSERMSEYLNGKSSVRCKPRY